MDVLRRRGNQFIDHYRAGKPPVLVFDHEVIVDGTSLERPCNYMLLRIKPEAGEKTDPTKRPYVVFDPRAGHGPGIGGSKEKSQVGVALRAGHPVYFVAFRPKPVPGQTLRDVALAEKLFLDKVAELHPDAEAKPAIVGNCQAGWAIMILSALAPDQASVISIAGSPLSYWAGKEGKDPMRYFGGLTGGNWLAALAADLGGGIFDGANLVSNFEFLNPANALIGKPYNLYSKVDTEADRYLGFERWWSGHFLLTRDEILELTSELFIGNKLTRGRLVDRSGDPVDLREIRAPIVVIASEGDNITPPPQALNWILDLYDDVEEIRANEQTIVYTVNRSVGHLGIFVSGKVAVKEHAEFVSSIELIETLPPGLFEMVIEEIEPEGGVTPGAPAYVARFEARTLDDIRAYDDGRDDEKPFEVVAQMSEVNEGLYETFVSPWLKPFANEGMAEMQRFFHPQRQRYLWCSDVNPFMAGIEVAANAIREKREEAEPDNVYRRTEDLIMRSSEAFLEKMTAQRDLMLEQVFKGIWTNPLVVALSGQAASYADSRKPRASKRKEIEELRDLKLAAIEKRCQQGSFRQAVMRVIYASIRETGRVDARGYAAAQEIWKSHPRFDGISWAELKTEAREAALMVSHDVDKALESLPMLLETRQEREEAVALLRRLAEWRPDVALDVKELMARVEKILGMEAPDGPRRIAARGAKPVAVMPHAPKAGSLAARKPTSRSKH
ncbi:DUF3141 domain-containing protein [Stappia sp. F7233]|uniref:DUF3141 domain-containing protein n=2 Tax=Stappia albiluteola TaxID=2758565 RepID=A0A839AD22_9HYPH|nr:DUF3141 domain-containing protein [Stappia albiluteola]